MEYIAEYPVEYVSVFILITLLGFFWGFPKGGEGDNPD